MTELARHLTDETLGQLIEARKGHDTKFKSVPEGAATQVWAAVVADGDEVGGRFCEDCGVAEVTDSDAPDGVRAYALDPDTAKALWARSEELVGERFE